MKLRSFCQAKETTAETLERVRSEKKWEQLLANYIRQKFNVEDILKYFKRIPKKKQITNFKKWANVLKRPFFKCETQTDNM